MKRNQPEHDEQVALMTWCKLHERKYPELNLLFAIPNGSARHISVAKKLKAEGVKSGVPDLCLPIARGKYHGAFIEMKCLPNKPSKNQAVWIDSLREQGYLSIVAYNWDTARQALEAYLGLK